MSHDETQAYRPQERTTAQDRDERLDRAIAEFLREESSGRSPDPQAWLERFPDLAEGLAEFFADRNQVEQFAGPMREALAPEPGSRVKYVGDYELMEELGRGGMGVVYRAQQLSLKRQVALKMILAGDHASAEDLARFRAEAEAAASLQHPHIVQIYEIGEHEGRPYAALELVGGGSLDHVLGGVPVPPLDAARLLERLAGAVHAAHRKGIIHRDLKPANILLASRDGPQAILLCGASYEPKITDFGLAKLVQEEHGQTVSGAILGTPSYMAPEQAAGKTREVGPAADIYALGAILYELLTGRPPFRAASPVDTLVQVTSDEPVPPRRFASGIPRDLETICLKCLEKSPHRRYHSAAELGDDLTRFLNHEPICARRVGAVERTWKWTRRRPAVAALLAVSLMAIIVLVAGAWRHNIQLERQLYQSLVEQARAERLAGNRQRSLELIAAAASRKSSHAEQLRLQREAAQSIFTPGVRFETILPAIRGRAAGFGPRGDLLLVDGEYYLPPKSAANPASSAVIQPRIMLFNVPSWRLREFHLPTKERKPGVVTNLCAIALSSSSPPVLAVLEAKIRGEGPVANVALWDPLQGGKLGEVRGAAPLVFSPNGRLLATGSAEGVVVWDVREQTKKHAPGPGIPVAFRGPQQLIVFDDGRLALHHLGAERESQLTPESMLPIDVSADGRFAALVERDQATRVHRVTLWDFVAAELTYLPDTQGDSDFLWNLWARFSPDGRWLAVREVVGRRAAFKIWSTSLREFTAVLPGPKWDGGKVYHHSPEEGDGFFSPNGSLFVAMIDGRLAQVWDVETGAEVGTIPVSYFMVNRAGYPSNLRDNRLSVWSQDGRWLLAQGEFPDGSGLGVWEIVDAPPTYQLTGAVTHLSFHRDGAQLAANATIWNAVEGSSRLLLRHDASEFPGDFAVFRGDEVWSADYRSIRSGPVQIRQVAPETRALELPYLGPSRKSDRPVRLTEAVAFSPDGTLMARYGGRRGAGNPGVFELWRLTDRRRLLRGAIGATKNVSPPSYRCLEFTPQGRFLVGGSSRGLEVWLVANGERFYHWRHEYERWDEDRNTGSQVQALAFSPDGRLAFSGSGGGGIHLADLSTGEDFGYWKAHLDHAENQAARPNIPEGDADGVLSLAVAPNGRVLASGGGDGDLCLWRVPQGEALTRWKTLRDHRGHWRLREGAELARWQAHEAAVTALAFHPDGKTLVSGSSDGEMKLWNLEFLRRELDHLNLAWAE